MASPTGIVKGTPFLPSNKKHAGKNAVKQAVAEKFYGKAVANNAQETVNTNTEEIHAVAKAAAKATMPMGKKCVLIHSAFAALRHAVAQRRRYEQHSTTLKALQGPKALVHSATYQ